MLRSIFFTIVLFASYPLGAVFAPTTLEQVPIDKLIENLNRKPNTESNTEKLNRLRNLARVHLMAYATGDRTGPLRRIDKNRDFVSFEEWLGGSHQSLKLGIIYPSRVNPEGLSIRKIHLQEGIKLYREALLLDDQNTITLLGLSWALLQDGKIPEAKVFLKKSIYESPSYNEAVTRLLDEGRSSLNIVRWLHLVRPVPNGSARLEITIEGKTVFKESILPYWVYWNVTHLARWHDVKGDKKILDDLALKYLRQPSHEILAKVLRELRFQFGEAPRVLSARIERHSGGDWKGIGFYRHLELIHDLHEGKENGEFRKKVERLLDPTATVFCPDEYGIFKLENQLISAADLCKSVREGAANNPCPGPRCDLLKQKSPKPDIGNLRFTIGLDDKGNVQIGAFSFTERPLSTYRPDVRPQIPKLVGKEIKTKISIGSAAETLKLLDPRTVGKLTVDNLPIGAISHGLGRTAVAEAAQYYLPLLDPNKDKSEIDSVHRRVGVEVSALRSLPITPLVVDLSGKANPSRFLKKYKSVAFDLTGNGEVERWHWIPPDAAWLIYKKTPDRSISGVNLFGNTTWWLFWNHGFQALSALDSDGDGFLSSGELENLRFWRDLNSNGTIESGELIDLRHLYVKRISVAHTRHYSGLLWNIRGIETEEGFLPVIDVVLKPAEGI